MSDEFTNISRPKVLYTYIKNVMVNARSLDQVHFKFIAPKDMLAKKIRTLQCCIFASAILVALPP